MFLTYAGRRLALRTIVAVLLGCTFIGSGLEAQGARDFSAFFEITQVSTIDPSHVQVRIVLELHNHSGEYLTQGKVLVRDRVQPGSTQELAKAELDDRAIVKLSGTVTVNATEYRLWRNGNDPQLFLSYINSFGRPVEKDIDLRQLPGLDLGGTP
jgi:hypothetical protein